jgi:hypothetical protein
MRMPTQEQSSYMEDSDQNLEQVGERLAGLKQSLGV